MADARAVSDAATQRAIDGVTAERDARRERDRLRSAAAGQTTATVRPDAAWVAGPERAHQDAAEALAQLEIDRDKRKAVSRELGELMRNVNELFERSVEPALSAQGTDNWPAGICGTTYWD
ncbi:MAG: hypothetical protein H0T75_04320 [Rhizobiales bacterium]|nr:hypothetical protein [Hyphomicrobiales bacterium]